MQNVSRAYKESMRGHIRNRGYLRATIGIVNTEAQKSLQADKEQNNLLYLSDIVRPFEGIGADNLYATAEQDFAKVDGSMFFTPPENSVYTIKNNGMITQDILGAIYVNFGGAEYDIKGLTIDFSDYYPVDFMIQTNRITRNYQNNDRRLFITEDTFDRTTFFKIQPVTMVNGQGRLRILSFSCGVTNMFTNDNVFDYSCTEYVSPIAETIPSIDVTLTVANYDMYYSPDNPDSALAYLEVGQEVRVSFGYDVNGKGKIEWLPEQKTYLKTWKATESNATFTSTDIFDYVSGVYYNGLYREDGISLYDLAEDIFQRAGLIDYYIDTYLKTVIVNNPMPPVDYSAALQIVANAGRCVLIQDRNGCIRIKSSFIPKMWASSDNQAPWSHVENVLKSNKKDGYANASNGYSLVDGSVLFYPFEEDVSKLNTGYISESIWIENDDKTVLNRLAFRLGNEPKSLVLAGYWQGETPSIVIDLEFEYTAFGLSINFRNTAPKEFAVATYRLGALVDYEIFEKPETEFSTDKFFTGFERMEIIFLKGHPNSRVFVDNIIIGDNTDYDLSRHRDLITSPVATRNTKVKSITVGRNVYRLSQDAEKEISVEEIVLSPENNTYKAYFSYPAYGITARVIDNPYITVDIIEKSSYYAVLEFYGITEETVVKYSISGYEYVMDEAKHTVEYNRTGEIIEWSNPLVSTVEHAKILEEWLAQYYLGDVEYEIDWKGDPAVDANDLFHLETKVGTSYIRDYENSLSFNGRWRGRMRARKVARQADVD